MTCERLREITSYMNHEVRDAAVKAIHPFGEIEGLD
jgi:hypothetical protein